MVVERSLLARPDNEDMLGAVSHDQIIQEHHDAQGAIVVVHHHFWGWWKENEPSVLQMYIESI